jgi:hypothetical protein
MLKNIEIKITGRRNEKGKLESHIRVEVQHDNGRSKYSQCITHEENVLERAVVSEIENSIVETIDGIFEEGDLFSILG